MGSVTGLTAAGLTGLHAAAGRHVGEGTVPGLVALVASGGQVRVEALGKLAVGGPAVARDSVFRIASTTKPITAAATLALAAEGLIGLDKPVDRLLPELAGRRVLRRPDGRWMTPCRPCWLRSARRPVKFRSSSRGWRR